MQVKEEGKLKSKSGLTDHEVVSGKKVMYENR